MVEILTHDFIMFEFRAHSLQYKAIEYSAERLYNVDVLFIISKPCHLSKVTFRLM